MNYSRSLYNRIPAKRSENPCPLINTYATICFHCEFCRGGGEDQFLQDAQLKIQDHPDLKFKVEKNQVLIEGCLRSDVGQERKITGNIVCIPWQECQSFLTKSKIMQSSTTVIVQVDTPKNHCITLHCNFKEKRGILLDSYNFSNGLEMYLELASELEHITEEMNMLLIPVAKQKEIDDGFFHALKNSLTVELSKHLTINQTFEIFLQEIFTFQGILNANVTKTNGVQDLDINRYKDLKRIAKERIKSGCAKGATLDNVEESVKTVCKNFTKNDELYVEVQYTKNVANSFLMLLQNHLETTDASYIDLLYNARTILKIKDIKGEPYNTIQNYEQLQKCGNLFDSKTNLRFFKRFHDLCHRYSIGLNYIKIEEKSFLNELQLHITKTNFCEPSTSKELPKYLQSSFEISDDKLKAKYVLRVIAETNDETLGKLQRLALQILENHSESFVISLKRLITQLSTSVVTENGMNILKCQGSCVDLETVNAKITADKCVFDKCSQIEIVAYSYFWINCTVKWPGKNVILLTDTLNVAERQTPFILDVSGIDRLPYTEKNARNGTSSDKDGLSGEHGLHGESGGNVVIVANIFKNSDNISIISNGGNGSDGQDGGTGVDGIDGVDGKGISEEKFTERFPDAAYFSGFTVFKSLITLKKNNTFTRIEQLPDSYIDIRHLKRFPNIQNYYLKTYQNYYLKGVTDDNHEVEYGLWTSTNPLTALAAMVGAAWRESYCICRGQPGTPGTPGGNGGIGGVGGKGGFEGKVDIYNWKGKQICTIQTSVKQGQYGSDGKDGKGGTGGKNGKKGNDRSHVCPSPAGSTRKFTGHLNIASYDGSSRERAFCPKREKYINIIKKSSEYPTLLRCRDGQKGLNTKRLNNRMTEPQRMKKAPISKKIIQRYHYIFYPLDSVRCNIETAKTITEDVASQYVFQHKRKTIKETKEHESGIVVQVNQISPTCTAEYRYAFVFTPMLTFDRNRHLEKFLMQKFKSVMDAVKKESKHIFFEKDMSTIFAILEQISIQNSFNEEHYENFLELIDLMRNKCMKPHCRENWTNLHLNYWYDRIVVNFKFYLLEKADLIVRLFMDEKEMEMNMDDSMSKTIMDDLRIRLNTLFQDLVLNILESDDVSHLKTTDLRLQKQVNKLMHEIMLYRRTVSLFGGNDPTCVDEDENSEDTTGVYKTIPCSTSEIKKDENSGDTIGVIKTIPCSTSEIKKVVKGLSEQIKETSDKKIDNESEYEIDNESEYEIESDIEIDSVSKIETGIKNKREKEYQVDANVEIGTASKMQLEFLNESDKRESFVSPKNDATLDELNIESGCEGEINALLEWTIVKTKHRAAFNCILKKLRYIQSDNVSLILRCLRYRLINQCCEVSEEFLFWFLMSLFENEECVANGKYLRIVATAKPEKWILEWIIQEMMRRSDLKDEVICRELVSKIYGHKVCLFICRYLSKLEEGIIMTKKTIKAMMGSLKRLNPDIDESFLIMLESINIFEWLYTIKWNENITALKSLPFSWQHESQLLDAAYYSSQVINRNGKKLIGEIYRKVKTYPVPQSIFLTALKGLYTGSLKIEINDLSIVQSSEEISRIFGNHFVHRACGIRTKERLLSIMKVDSITLAEDEVEKFGIILLEIAEKGSQPSTVLANKLMEKEDQNTYTTKSIASFTENDIQAWSEVCKQTLKSNALQFPSLFTEMVAVIERAITLKRSFRLRSTQTLSIIAFFSVSNVSQKGILQQMSTGEGKTIVIVVLSILKSLLGEKVDIITSSSILAKRDSSSNTDMFDLFQITVKNNCSENKHDRQDAYSSQVVYGEIGTFQRDILLTEFYDENIIGGRDRENIIADEVDSMLLDKGETVLYLSHEIAGIDALEFVYTYIWSLVNSKEMIGTDRDCCNVRRCMLDAIYGIISKEDINEYSPPENTTNVNVLWNILQKENIIDHEGRLLTRNYARFEKLEHKDVNFTCNKAGYLINMLKDTVRKGILVEVPKFLESFVNRHLDTWIRNAFNAKLMEEGKHFIIDVDRTENNRGKDANIVIMDIDTGTEQYNMQWNAGLHQFLQLKYKCAISAESLKAVFMSNISFFRLYKNVYGLSGTLGSQKERNLMKNIYKVSYITIPAFKEQCFVEYDPILCKSTDSWMISITETAVSLSESRPVLVICETIQCCDEFEKEFKRKRVNVHVYKNSYRELSILKNETCIDSGCIILATNLAGRGTDIKISQNISVLGGLHVILTYLPSNHRIEEQAFGRAARKGQHGSGQLIVCNYMEGQPTTKEMVTLLRMKIQRDKTENERISKIQQRYETFIRVEEKLFKMFQKYYDEIKQSLISKNIEESFQNVICSALLDRWAFWLDSVKASLKSSENVSSVMNKFSEFLSELNVSRICHDSSSLTKVLQSPTLLVKAGKAKTAANKYDEAHTFFDTVINYDPSFSESALYYKVQCLLKRGDCTDDDFKIVRNNLADCKCLIQQHIEKIRNAVQLVNVISSQYTNKRVSLTVSEGFSQQKENAIQIYNQIIDSIDSITGYAIEPFMFEDVIGSRVNSSMIFRDLDIMEILRPHTVRVYPPDKPAWRYVEKSYELYSEEILLRLERLKDKDRVSARDFKDILPSREQLWKLLTEKGVLKDQQDFILFDEGEYKRSIDKLPEQITESMKFLRDNRIMTDFEMYVFLYPDQKQLVLEDNETSLIPINTFKETLGFGKVFEVLQRGRIVSTGSFALLAFDAQEKVMNGRLQKFDNVGCNSFLDIGVPIDTSKTIFDQLVANEIVSRDGKLLLPELGSIWLPTFSNYTTEIRNIVAKYSKYRKCALYFLMEQEFPLDLFSRPHDILFGDLIETGIVTPFNVMANISEEKMTKQLNFLYGFECDKKKTEIIKILRSRIDDIRSGKYRYFWRLDTELRKMLHEEGSGLGIELYLKRVLSELPKISSSEIEDLCRGTSNSGIEIEKKLIDKMICVRSDSKAIKNLTVVMKNDELKTTSLKQEVGSLENEIKCFISSRIQNYQNTSSIVAQLERWKEGITKFENVNTELQSLEDRFTEEQLICLCDEILSITNNGFGDLIVLTERKWTCKSICNMICILAIGLIQIGISIAIELFLAGTGTFVANAFLSEGFGDIMFVAECMLAGHCTMQSYVHNKALSVALTVASAGIGAFAARGSQFSRFGHKIGGQFLQNHTAKNLLNQGVAKRLLAKAAAKHIGNKLVEVTSLTLIDKGINFAIENALRAFIVNLCCCLKAEGMDIVQTRKTLNKTVSVLAKTFGKQNAKDIVDNVMNECLRFQESTFSTVLSKIGEIADFLSKGLGEATEKLKNCGDPRVKYLGKLTKTVIAFQKGIQVGRFGKEVVTLRSSILENIHSKIIDKLQFEDGHVEVDACQVWASEKVDDVIKKVNNELTKYLEIQFENIVVKPMLQEVGKKVARHVSTGVRKIYRYGEKKLHQRSFKSLKSEAERKSRLPLSSSEMKDDMQLQYIKNLLKLLKKTRSPSLFADLVEEGIPLDIHSVQAVSEITSAVIKVETIGGDAITMPQTFTPCGMHLKRQDCITIQFHANSETGIGHFVSLNNMDGESKHFDCLLTAVMQATGMTLERQTIAETIRKDPAIRRNIQHGIHEYFISKGGVGGATRKKAYPKLKDVIKKINEEKFCKLLRDHAKKTHHSEKGTGNDELIPLEWLKKEYIAKLPQFRSTKIEFGHAKEEVSFYKVFINFRVDTRYVIFMHNGKLQGHAGALYDITNQKFKNKIPNGGALTAGQRNFHKQRIKAIQNNTDNVLKASIILLTKHIELLAKETDLQSANLTNYKSAIGYMLSDPKQKQNFINAYEKEKYKLCIAAEYLIDNNKNSRHDKIFQTYKKSLKDLKQNMVVDKKFKNEIDTFFKNVDSLESFGNVMKNPIQHL